MRWSRNLMVWIGPIVVAQTSLALAQPPGGAPPGAPTGGEAAPPAPGPPPPPAAPSPAPPTPAANQPPPSQQEQQYSTPPNTTPSPGEYEAPPAISPQATPPPSEAPPDKPTMEIYGFAMTDLGYDFGQIGDPAWEDVLRPTKLPAFPDEFGKGGRWFQGVRQSRFGVNATMPTSAGEIKTKFEFELFGVGVDAGQTTFRLRHFYGEWRGVRAGQTWSPFMDPDVFPDSIEYWGPNGMVFFRNVQLAYSPYREGESDVTIAIERPGASADSKALGERIELENVVPRFPAPDVSADVKLAWPWGYVRLAGIFRYIRWDDLGPTPTIQGHVYGWGANLSSNIKLAPVLLKLQAVYGSAIENYMNDAGADVAPDLAGDPATITRVEGDGLPVLGLVAFADVSWNDYLTSTAGYSFVWVDNSSGQTPDAFHIGHYALANLLIHPTKNLIFGPEFQWGRRQNKGDDTFSANDYRLQFSIKYLFSHELDHRR